MLVTDNKTIFEEIAKHTILKIEHFKENERTPARLIIVTTADSPHYTGGTLTFSLAYGDQNVD